MIVYLLTLFLHSAFAFDCQPGDIEWKQIAPGLSWAKYDSTFTPYNAEKHLWEKEFSRSVTVRALKVDLNQNQMLFKASDKDLACDLNKDRYIQKIIEDQGDETKKILAAINASFFVMPKGNILGVAKDEKKVWSDRIDSQIIKSSHLFLMKDNQFKMLSRTQFKDQLMVLSDYPFALQAYPGLLKDSELLITDSVKIDKRSRTSLGFKSADGELILVTIDARGETFGTGMSLFEYAHFLKNEKCGVAQATVLNLDGGGSTAFAIPTLNLYEQADRCRHLGNILTIQSR